MPSLVNSRKDQSSPGMESRLPTCRNYWRFSSTPSPPQRPSSYLLKPHLIASSMCEESEGKNPNSKYYKLRHGAGQFSPNEDLLGYHHQYRVRLPFDPTPFRGITRLAFWIVFLSILVFLCVLITSLLRVEDFHAHRKPEQGYRPLISENISSASEERISLGDSLIWNALSKHHSA